MIIDIHGHYTTEPPALHAFRDRQLADLADAAPRRRAAFRSSSASPASASSA